MYNGTIETDHVFASCHKFVPPARFDVALELTSKWTVVVKTGIAIVDFTAGEDKSPSLAQPHNVVKAVREGDSR